MNVAVVRGLWAIVIGVVGIFAAMMLYWLLEPIQSLQTQFPVDVVTQQYGTSSIIRVPQLDVLESQKFSIYAVTIDLQGKVQMVTPALAFVKGSNTYAAMTYRNLPVGNYNVVIHLNYTLNPFRDIHQSFVLATVAVLGAPDVYNNNKPTKSIRPKDPPRVVRRIVPRIEHNYDSLLYSGA